MIGIFDSGSGGLTFLAAMKRRFPDFSYIYFADYEHCPFGERTPDEIQKFTIAGAQKLFDAGAEIVILACNTASAWTLQMLQVEVFPDKKILSVTIPGAEKVVALGCSNVAVFATEQTVKSRTYTDRMRILDTDIQVREFAFSGDLVRDIEGLLPVKKCHSEADFAQILSLYGADGWNCENASWNQLVNTYFSDKFTQGEDLPNAIVLGCTHYSYLGKPLQQLFNTHIIDPSEEAAEKLGVYLEKHPDLFSRIERGGGIKFL